MLHRIRNCFKIPIKQLDNIVEIDEAFIGGKNKNRHYDKKVKRAQGRSCKYKAPVLGMFERGGNLIAKVVENTQANTLLPLIKENVLPTASVMTDEWVAYNSL